MCAVAPGKVAVCSRFGSRTSARRRWSCLVALVNVSLSAAGHAAFTVTDFAVDPAHATLGNPHEVASPDFDNFQVTIYGTFDTSKCYQVTVKHEGGGPCGSANS